MPNACRMRQTQRGVTCAEPRCKALCGDYFKPQALTALLARLAQAHPRMRLQVQVGKSTEVGAAWSQGALDLALTMAVVGNVALHPKRKRAIKVAASA